MTTLLISQPTPPLSLLSPSPQATTPVTTIPVTTAPTPILGYGKELVNAAKLYTNNQKYSSISGNFNFKLTIFYDICNRADVPPDAYLKALPLMLIGLALNYYYNTRLAVLMFEDACKSLYGFFRGPSTEHKSLNEWNLISLQTVIQKNTDKSTSQCFQILITELSQLQHGLNLELQRVLFFL